MIETTIIRIASAVAILGGLIGLLVSLVTTLMSARRKKNVTLTVSGSEITFDAKNLSPEDAKRIIDLIEHKDSGPQADNSIDGR